jgi:glycosyltransferase involved in cell wall biosynthesis
LEIASEPEQGAQIIWRGAIPDAGRLLRAFDVVVLSSRTEGTPMVLLEAMDAGVPVVTTRVGGIPDMVGPDEVLLVDPDDPEALLTAILDATSNKEAAVVRAEQARQRLESQFDPATWLKAHEDLYRSVCSKSSGAQH